jgi:hypothetical protein
MKIEERMKTTPRDEDPAADEDQTQSPVKITFPNNEKE